VRHAAAPGVVGAAPSDLPIARALKCEIEWLERQYPQIEDVLPCAVAGGAFIPRAFMMAGDRDPLYGQMELGFEGALDSEALEAAARTLLGVMRGSACGTPA